LQFQLTNNENSILRDLTTNLKKVSKPGKSTKINPFALSKLFDSDLNNYLFYWGERGNENKNPILWMISPKLVSINDSQVRKIFRKYNRFDREIDKSSVKP